MQRNTLIFDLDGTIANTAPDLIGTLNRITNPYGLKPVSVDQVGQIVGHGAKAMIEKAFSIAGNELSEALLDQLFNLFIEDYAANIAVTTHIFDGLEESLKELSSSGYNFCVCTNKREDLARLLLDELKMTHWFPVITGGNTFEFRKPDPQHLIATAAMLGSSIDQAIMIGDSETDINAARGAEIPSVAVTFGYANGPVEALGATAVINDFSQLPDEVRKINATP